MNNISTRKCFLCQKPLTIGDPNILEDCRFEWCSYCFIEDAPLHWCRAWKSACFWTKQDSWGIAIKEINRFVLFGKSSTGIQEYNREMNHKSFDFVFDINNLTYEQIISKVKLWLTFQ